MGRINISKIILYIFLITCISTSIIPILLSLDLLQAHDYDSIVSILDKSYVTHSYFVRVIMQNLDYTKVSISSIYASLVTSLSFLNIFIILLTGYVWAMNKEKWMQKHFKNMAISLVCFYLFGYGIIALILVVGFQASNAGAVISLFSIVGWIMLILHTTIILYAIYNLILCIRKQWIPYIKKQFPL